jgi:hypothetical protein
MNTTDNPQHNDPARPDPHGWCPRSRGSAPSRRSDEYAGGGAGRAGRPRRQAARARSWAGRGVGAPDRPDRPALGARAGRGLDFQAELARRTRTPLGAGFVVSGIAPGGCRRSRRSGAAPHHVAGVPLRGLDELTVVTGHGCDGIGMGRARGSGCAPACQEVPTP